MKHFIVCALALFIVAASPSPAPAQFVSSPQPPIVVAQPESTAVINVGAIFGAAAPYINAVANDLIYAGMAWLFWLLKTKLNVNIDSEHRASLTAAAQRQASSLIADGAVTMQGKTVTVDNNALAEAVSALIAAAPGAIDRFGITPEKVADRIKDMIPQVPAGAQIVAAATAPAVVPVPAPPAPPAA